MLLWYNDYDFIYSFMEDIVGNRHAYIVKAVCIMFL
jgi:hypothetical protein